MFVIIMSADLQPNLRHGIPARMVRYRQDKRPGLVALPRLQPSPQVGHRCIRFRERLLPAWDQRTSRVCRVPYQFRDRQVALANRTPYPFLCVIIVVVGIIRGLVCRFRWPRGNGFCVPATSAVISTIDHPLGSPQESLSFQKDTTLEWCVGNKPRSFAAVAATNMKCCSNITARCSLS
jgi:hypothetical protein